MIAVAFDHRRRCRDCPALWKHWYPFVLVDATWYAAGLGPHDVACLPCVEARLRRRVILEDFARVPLNNVVRFVLR